MKKKVLLIILGALAITGCNSNKIREKDLENGLNNFINSKYNEANYEANIEDDKIIVNYSDNKYEIDYTLKNNPTFTYEFVAKKGISYEEYSNKIDGMALPMLGYIAIANKYETNEADAYTFFANTYLEGMFDAITEKDFNYIISDTKEDYGDDVEVILTSEFGDKVIEYTKETYGNSIKIEDNDYNTFTYEFKANCDNESCKITATLIVNKEGNFSKLNGYADEKAKENMDENITPENADYNIELVVGQTITINNVTGYGLSGMDIIEATSDEESYTFTATRVGIANGEFHLENDKTKTFYITVNEKDKNSDTNSKELNVK